MELSTEWSLIWLFTISVASAATALWDKLRARHHRWRVPERTLWLLSALGGAAAMWLIFRAIRHKTRHRRFMWGLPLLVVAQGTLLFVLWHEGWLVFA